MDGKPYVRQLADDNGRPITSADAAKTAKVAFMAPFRVADRATALEAIAAKLATAASAVEKVAAVKAGEITVANAWASYLDSTSKDKPDSGERTLKGYAGQWERFADWWAEHCPDTPALRDVTEARAAEYARNLAAGVAPGTFNKHRDLLALVFRVLAKPAMIQSNPFAEVGRKTPMPRGRRELTVEELQRVCAEAKGELRTLLAIGTYTGLRLGDAATLNWSEVDLLRGRILRVPNKTARRHPDKPVEVPIHKTLAAVLGETPTKARRGDVLPETAATYRRAVPTVTNQIQAHFAACGVRTIVPGTGFTADAKGKTIHSGKRAVVEVGFHSLRHTFVSLCRAADAPLSVVEAIVGHSNPAMTRHYTHTGEAAARLAIGALPSLAGEDASQPPALPAPEPWRARVRELAEGLTPANIEDTRHAMLALAKAVA
jgi:integrase